MNSSDATALEFEVIPHALSILSKPQIKIFIHSAKVLRQYTGIG